MDLPAASKPGTGLPGLRDKAAWFIYPFFGIHMLLSGMR